MKIAIKIGKFLEKYIQSYGTSVAEFTLFGKFHKIWPRRKIVNFIDAIIAQISEETYFRNRNTMAWRDKDNKNFYWYDKIEK